MPFRTWSVGEELLASDFNTFVGNQVVATFVDAAQRTAQLASPDVGQLSTLDNKPGALYIFNGSSWVETAPYIQSGSTVVTTNASGGAVINFPIAFAAPPIVQLIDGDVGASGGITFGIIVTQRLATAVGFVIRYAPDGVPLNTVTVRVDWLAHGLRA